MRTLSRRLTGSLSLEPYGKAKSCGQQQPPDRLKLRDIDRCQYKALASARGFIAPQ